MPYFDHNATTPLLPAAREAWLQAGEQLWQNPSSPYRDAARVRIRLDAVRARLAEFMGCASERLVFTSGATEAANAIVAHWLRTLPPQAQVAVSPVEHPALLEPLQRHFSGRLAWLPLADGGVVRLDGLEDLLASKNIAAVVVMAANNETGVIQPWRDLAALCKRHGVEYLCDASQWLGKLPASGLGDAGWVVGSAHKFGGPKGAGLLVRADGAPDFQGQLGGAQQRGHRGGTEDLPGAAAMLAALTEAEQKCVFLETGRLVWRARFEQAVVSAVTGATVLAPEVERLWNTVSILMPHTENTRWVTRLDRLGFQVSTGSACSTGRPGASHVLAAMRVDPVAAHRVLRISSGWGTTESEWQGLAAALVSLDKEFRNDTVNVITP